MAAEKSGWHKALAQGRGRGIAASFGWGSYVAPVAEVTSNAKTGAVRAERVVCVIAGGTAVNPLGVKAQMESAINFGLAATLKSAITVERGRIQQGNFHDYEVLRMSDAPPVVEVYTMPSTEPPGGCGEPGVPSAAPAVGDAIFAATGKDSAVCPSGPPIWRKRSRYFVDFQSFSSCCRISTCFRRTPWPSLSH